MTMTEQQLATELGWARKEYFYLHVCIFTMYLLTKYLNALIFSFQAAKAKPLTTQNQNSTITYQPPPGAYSSTSQQIPVATVPTPSTYQQHRNRAAHYNNSRVSSAQQQVDRVPVPLFKQGSSPIADLSILDLNYFFVKILKWNASWFDEYGENLNRNIYILII